MILSLLFRKTITLQNGWLVFKKSSDIIASMNTKRIFYLIGYPASGKTSLAKYLARYGYDYVSTDSIFDELYNKGYHYSQIVQVQREYAALEILKKGFKCDNIVVDTYRPYRYERQRLLAEIPASYEKIAVVMDASVEECVDRFKKRGKTGKGFTPYFANEKIEPPSLEEFDRIITEVELKKILENGGKL